MKRFAVSLLSLVLSIGVARGGPESLLAAPPPPPCPVGDTFIFCVASCPINLNEWCLNAIGHPAECRVASSACQFLGLVCNPPEGSYEDQVFCTYDRG